MTNTLQNADFTIDGFLVRLVAVAAHDRPQLFVILVAKTSCRLDVQFEAVSLAEFGDHLVDRHPLTCALGLDAAARQDTHGTPCCFRTTSPAAPGDTIPARCGCRKDSAADARQALPTSPLARPPRLPSHPSARSLSA
jgi:hypothetical protein